MTSDEIQLKAQRAVQEYEDAVENLDARFAELGRASVAALDELIAYWNERPESPASRRAHGDVGDAGGEGESDMQEYVERQLEWARHERERIVAQLSKNVVK
jgi:vacuolar-type H+-ATPase subunit H